MPLLRRYIFTSKTKNLCSFLQIYGVIYDNNDQYIEDNIRLEHLLSIFTTNLCKAKIVEIVNQKDIFHVKDYREIAKSINLKVTIIENLDNHFIIATKSLKENVSE